MLLLVWLVVLTARATILTCRQKIVLQQRVARHVVRVR